MKAVPFKKPCLIFNLLLSVTLAALLVGGIPPAAHAQIRLNLGDVDIHIFIRLISRLTGKIFIADEDVKGKVNVFSPGEVTREEAYQIFLGVLEVMGYSTLPTAEGITKIILSEKASRSNPQILLDRPPSVKRVNFQTRVIPIKHLKVEDVQPMVSAMISSVGQLIVFRRNNALVVSDYRSNIDRILEVLAVFDQAGLGDHVEVIPLQFSPAEAIAKVLRDLRPDVVSRTLGAAGARPVRRQRARRSARRRRGAVQPVVGDKSPITIIADERINAIVLMGPKAQTDELKKLIATLDVQSTSLRKNIYVHPLKNASAEELLPVIRELISGEATGGGRSGPRRRTARRARTTARARARARPGRRRPEEDQGATFLEELKIVADKGTNAFIITATKRDYEALKPVIEKLDMKRRQVHIEAIIVEISEAKAKQLGFDFQSARGVDGGLLIGRTNTTSNLPRLVAQQAAAGQTAPAAGNIASFFGLSGLAALAISGANVLTPDGQSIPAHVLLFRALETDTEIEVLSRPSILTRDNQEAEIVVGSNVPFIVSTQADRSDPNAVFSQIERRDIGVILRITPQITEGDFIKLDLFQEISSIQENPPNFDVNTQGLVLRKRSAKTSIIVKDRQLLVIGGLVSDDVTRTRTAVPLLSRIPIIGRLFRFDSKRREKTNLLILLTPRVVRDPDESLAANPEDVHEIVSPPLEASAGLGRSR